LQQAFVQLFVGVYLALENVVLNRSAGGKVGLILLLLKCRANQVFAARGGQVIVNNPLRGALAFRVKSPLDLVDLTLNLLHFGVVTGKRRCQRSLLAFELRQQRR